MYCKRTDAAALKSLCHKEQGNPAFFLVEQAVKFHVGDRQGAFAYQEMLFIRLGTLFGI